MIYYHRKYFDEMKRALDKEKQEALLHEDSRVIEQAKSLLQNPSKKQIGGNFFYTNVDIEKQATPQAGEGMEEQNAGDQQEEVENREIENNIQQQGSSVNLIQANSLNTSNFRVPRVWVRSNLNRRSDKEL